MAMQDLNDLYFFAQVVDHNGFAAAARALGMPRSRLSRRIGLLADAAQEAIERVRAEPQGIVRVSCPSPLLYFQVGEMVVRFMAECPKVEVHLESTSRPVDVIREGFDVAIRARFPPLEESDLVMKVLAESPQRLVATPAVLQGLSHPFVPADLSTLPSLAWGPPHQDHEWRLEGPHGATARIPHRSFRHRGHGHLAARGVAGPRGRAVADHCSAKGRIGGKARRCLARMGSPDSHHSRSISITPGSAPFRACFPRFFSTRIQRP